MTTQSSPSTGYGIWRPGGEGPAALPVDGPVVLAPVPASAGTDGAVTPARQRAQRSQRLRIDAPILPAGNRSPIYLGIKRTIDIIGASVLIVLLSPILISTWLVLMVTTKGRPIFAQERIGHLGRPFRVYKFRTMVLDAERVRHLVRNEKDGPIFKNRVDPRITRVGRWLRVTSIDEMPQLFNVLRGQMALVGPRPPLAAEVAEYEPWQRVRLAVKPGLTCLWQVSGRSEVGFDQWMRMDAWYVEHQTLFTDLALLWRTPWAVVSRRGAY